MLLSPFRSLMYVYTNTTIVTKLLNACGAQDNVTMVMEAAKGGHTPVVRMLLEYPNNLSGHHLQQAVLNSSQELANPHSQWCTLDALVYVARLSLVKLSTVSRQD